LHDRRRARTNQQEAKLQVSRAAASLLGVSGEDPRAPARESWFPPLPGQIWQCRARLEGLSKEAMEEKPDKKDKPKPRRYSAVFVRDFIGS